MREHPLFAPQEHPLRPGAPKYDAVVIGGSSGGIDALATVLPALPAAMRAAVLVVMHLPRDKPSLLATIFRQRCALALREAHDKEPITPGTVYFAPPDYHLLVDAGPRIALSVDAPVHYSRPSIDVLFESAADQYGERLIGIVLSGANEDGAQGLRAVAQAGGLAIVQDPASAAMPTMPQAALAHTQGASQAIAPAGIAGMLAQMHRQGQL